MGKCNHCDICGENYDYGERHICEELSSAAQPLATEGPYGCGVPLAGEPVRHQGPGEGRESANAPWRGGAKIWEETQ